MLLPARGIVLQTEQRVGRMRNDGRDFEVMS